MTSTEKNLKFLIYIGLAILLFVPFVVSNSLFFPYITGKAYTFRIVTEIIVGIYLILAVLYPIYRPKINWILVTFAAFVVSLFVSNQLGINPLASFWSNFERMEGWVTIAHLFALFLALGSVLREKKEWLWLFNASIIVSLFMVFSAFGQVLESGFNTRVDTKLGNSTYLAIYMLFNAFLSLFFLLREKISFTGWYSWFYGVTFVLQSVVVFQTGTRGTMLGLLGGIVLAGLIIAIFNKENQVFRKTAFSLIGAVAIFIAGVFVFKDTGFVQNNIALNRIASVTAIEGTSQARINNWKMAIKGFNERPMLGWGQSNFNYVFDKHYLPEHHGNETWFDRVHNILFDWLIAGGIFGLLFYVSIWVASLFHIWKASLDKIAINEKAVLVGMLGGYFVHNLFVFDQIVSYMYWIFILAFIYSQSQQKENSLFQKELSEKTKQVLVVIICVVIPVSMYFINYPSYAANKDLIGGMTIIKTDVSGQPTFNHENGIYGNIEAFESALSHDSFANPEIRERILLTTNQILRIESLDQEAKQDYVQFAIDEMEKQIEKFPNNSRYRYLFGTFFAQIGQFELAEKYLLEAIEISPTKQVIRTPLMKVYAMSDQPEKAIALARETYELDESKKDLWREYVNMVIRLDSKTFENVVDETIESGKQEWVEELLKEQIESSPDSFQNRVALAIFYKKVGDLDSARRVVEQASEDFPENTIQLQSLKEYIEAESDSDDNTTEFIN
ncbi:hypothetical protein GW764_01870 [Candidatus Parcubacteria bacterium]|nr:hypothetical protein [Candidatus Parcubacteria bacterium]